MATARVWSSSASDNTGAPLALRSAGALPAHTAICGGPHITGVPYFADPVVLGVRDQPARDDPGRVLLDAHDRDASFALFARTTCGDPRHNRVRALGSERLGELALRRGQVRPPRGGVPAGHAVRVRAGEVPGQQRGHL